jgi:hypothetical protein
MIAFDEVAQSERHRAAAHDDGEPALAAEAQSTLYPLRRRGAPAGEANGQAQGPPAASTQNRTALPCARGAFGLGHRFGAPNCASDRCPG